jgi:hypothetical protein
MTDAYEMDLNRAGVRFHLAADAGGRVTVEIDYLEEDTTVGFKLYADHAEALGVALIQAANRALDS